MGLNLQLKPDERIAVNGAILRNPTNHTIDIRVENQSVIIREKDFMKESEATTPCRRLYFLAMLTMLDEDNAEAHRNSFTEWLGEIMGALRNPIAIAAAHEIAGEVASGRYHRALKGIRHLIEYEDLALRGAVAETPTEATAA